MKHTAALLALTCLLSTAVAQNPVRRCDTDERLDRMIQQNPALRHTQEKADAADLADKASTPIHRTAGGGVRIIPVVVHLIQSSPVVKISDARVQSQIDVLNEDFRRLNADTINTPADFLPVAADAEIQFCLATIDPNGCPTNGINRIVNTPLSAHNSDTDEDALKALIQWDPYKYLNVWVPDRITNSVLGYATFPTWLSSDPDHDGVVVSGTYFGRGAGTPSSSYDLGRTTTHEVGHWLGLRHTFQGGCAGTSASNCATAGDRCCDTPPTAADNFGCPLTKNTCTETPTDLPDQTANYMDYVDDRCMNLFTEDQKDWFFFYLDGARSNIWSAVNLAATGCDGSTSSICAPTVQFTSDYRHICAGQTVQFTDLSFGPPDTWNWDFPGGVPATSTVQHPTVVYSTPGVYAVTLSASNSLGSGTDNETTWIVVSAASNPPLVEGFESGTALPVGWEAQDEDGQGSWIVSTLAGSAGANSAAIDNYTINAEGTSDGLVTQPLNLKLALSASLSFDYAHRRSNAFRYDSLSVWVSTDCGLTWTSVWERGGGPLATVTGYQVTTPYVPIDSTHWRTETVDLMPFLGHEEVKIKFRSDGRNGQWLYLDQINLTAIVSRDEAQQQPVINVWPNPTGGAMNLQLHLPSAGEVEITVRDLAGSTILQMPSQPYPAGTTTLQLETETLAQGAYILTAIAPTGSAHLKIIRR